MLKNVKKYTNPMCVCDEWKGIYDICVDTSAADPSVDQAIAYNPFVTLTNICCKGQKR